MSDQPLISVLLNVYNGADYLRGCIRSVLDQSYPKLELIIADDASTDATLEIIRSFDDPRLRYTTRTQRRHIPYTFNEALSQARGDYIAHIDHDDEWRPDKLERQLAYLNAHPEVGVCFSQVDLIDGTGAVVNGDYPGLYQMFSTSFDTREDWVRQLFFRGNCLCNSSFLARRAVMEAQNLFCRQSQDYELWCRLIPKTLFHVLPEPLVRYRWSGSNASAANRTNNTRLDNETLLLIRRQLLEDLSDEQLKACFGADFRCPDAETPLELDIERAFLLCQDAQTQKGVTAPGLAAFEALLRRDGAVELLEEKYHLSLPELYELTGRDVFYTRQTAEDEAHAAQLDEALAEARAANQQARTDLARMRARLTDREAEAKALRRQLEETKQELETYRREYTAAIAQRDGYLGRVSKLEQDLQATHASMSWRLTAPMRKITGQIRKMPHVLLVCKALRHLLRHGVRSTWRQVKRHRAMVRRRKAQLAWEAQWTAERGELAPPPAFGCTREDYEAQRSARFPREIKFSILVPLYNTPERFLREMIASVRHQTYENWELCLADGSDAGHGEVEQICRALAAEDPRIVYRKLEKNLGISGNTNACIEMSTGDYIALFDHDDLLHPSALYENMRAICDQGADFIYTDENTFHDTPRDAYCPHFKPDFAPDTLRANNYICHFTVFSRALLEKAGPFRSACDGSQDFDMVLRLTEQARTIVHIPKILYYWRAHRDSVASDVGAKPYVIEAAHRAVGDHLKRIGLPGQVLDSAVPSMYRLKYDIPEKALVSIVICTKDHIDDLKKCVDSILSQTTYPNYEILIVENNSTEPETFAYYRELERDSRIRVVTWESPSHEFNYSAINNFGVARARGKYVLLLNNDTEVISPEWLEELVMYAQRSDVGAVGAKLYYPDDTIQHAGIGIGLLTLAGHYHRNFPRSHPGYMGRLIYAQDVSAVTGACVMLRREVWDRVGGLDESFKVAFNDVDLCMRIRQAGYLIVWTPFAELYHYESKSRGLDESPEKRARFVGEVERFQTRWAKELAAGDPYYNPNFSLDSEDFSIRPESLL